MEFSNKVLYCFNSSRNEIVWSKELSAELVFNFLKLSTKLFNNFGVCVAECGFGQKLLNKHCVVLYKHATRFPLHQMVHEYSKTYENRTPSTVDSRYLEFFDTRSVYLNQKYILIAFSNLNLALETFLQVQITRSANKFALRVIWTCKK